MSIIFAIAHSALSPALGHEPFGSERLDLSSSTSLKAELLGPNGVNKYVIEFMNRGTKPFNIIIIGRHNFNQRPWIGSRGRTEGMSDVQTGDCGKNKDLGRKFSSKTMSQEQA